MIQKAETMTRKSTAILIALVALTLAGFSVVSNVITDHRQRVKAPDSAAVVKPTPTPTPQATVSPQPTPSKSPAAETQIRADLLQAQNLLDQLNADVAGGAWDKANGHFNEFEQKMRLLPAPQLNHPDISPVMQDFFTLYKVQLGRALSQQDAQGARFATNQIFGIVSEQRARFGTRGVPLEFQRLHFLIREVEIWSQSGDQQMLRLRVSSLRDVWKEIRPVIAAKRNSQDQVKNFDALIERLSAVDQAQDVAPLVSDMNKGFEQMNTLFQRSTRPAGTSGAGGRPAEDDD
jgi:hypothetical protein